MSSTGAPEPEDDLRGRLSEEQYRVTQEGDTERPFTGLYWDCHDPGIYRCVVCHAALYDAETKYDSGTGWPSFTQPIRPEAVVTRTDTSHGMVRTEAICGSCGAHLGHVFDDGPGPTGQRHCMNSAALSLERPD